jgi:hypothetical protein
LTILCSNNLLNLFCQKLFFFLIAALGWEEREDLTGVVRGGMTEVTPFWMREAL